VWVRVGSGGAVDVTNATGSSHLVVDVEGYYTSASGSGDVVAAVNGTKLFDSRPTKNPVPANGVQTVQVTGHAGVPSAPLPAERVRQVELRFDDHEGLVGRGVDLDSPDLRRGRGDAQAQVRRGIEDFGHRLPAVTLQVGEAVVEIGLAERPPARRDLA